MLSGGYMVVNQIMVVVVTRVVWWLMVRNYPCITMIRNNSNTNHLISWFGTFLMVS